MSQAKAVLKNMGNHNKGNVPRENHQIKSSAHKGNLHKNVVPMG